MWEVCQAKLHSRSQSLKPSFTLLYFLTMHVFVGVLCVCRVHFSLLKISTLRLWDECACL